MEVTVKLVDPAEVVTFWFGGVTERVSGAPACVTVTTTGESPLTITVMLAIRLVVSKFCV